MAAIGGCALLTDGGIVCTRSNWEIHRSCLASNVDIVGTVNSHGRAERVCCRGNTVRDFCAPAQVSRIGKHRINDQLLMMIVCSQTKCHFIAAQKSIARRYSSARTGSLLVCQRLTLEEPACPCLHEEISVGIQVNTV